MTKIRGHVPIEVGENERFSPEVFKKLIGTTTKDGWLVVDARNDGPQRIWLTVEKETKE